MERSHWPERPIYHRMLSVCFLSECFQCAFRIYRILSAYLFSKGFLSERFLYAFCIFSKLYKSYRADERSKKELNLTLEQFIAAAEAMLDGVIAINQNNEILWCNKPAQTMLKINLKKNYKQPINYVFRNTDFSNY